MNGRLVGSEEASARIHDRGTRNGEGLFETFRMSGGRPFRWQKHLERLVVSAAELGFPVAPDPELLRAALAEVVAAAGLTGEAVGRITMTRGVPGTRPTRAGVWVEAEPLENRLWSGARTQSAHLVISRRPFEAGILGRHKTTSRLAYELCREEARAAGADETLLVDSRGRLLEGTVSNVFVVVDGRLLTPPLTLPILPGIARATTIERALALGIAVAEEEIDRELLTRAEEVFVTNSIQEVVPASRVGERRIEAKTLGARLAASYREVATREMAGG